MLGTWDAPTSFDRGDSEHDEVFEAVGRVMSHWEAVEFELARLFSRFCGDPDGASIMQYGIGQVFSARLQSLAEAGARHFVTRPDQAAEGDFSELCQSALLASARRNEIAHGIVFRVDKITHFRNQIPVSLLNRTHYALIPPLYLLRKHLAGLPTFAYRSRDMDILCERLVKFAEAVTQYRVRHFP